MDGHEELILDALHRIESKVDQTNGRVRALELWKARVEGVRWAYSWVPTFLTGTSSGVLGVIVGVVLS